MGPAGRVQSAFFSSLILLAAALVASMMAFGAASASAEYRHPTMTYTFGADGTEGSTLRTPSGLAYNEAEGLLYVIENEPPRRIQAWKALGPTSFPPLGGAFPLEVEGGGNDPDLEVDNSALPTAGHLIHVRRAGSPSEIFDRKGNFLFEVNVLSGEGGLGGANACGAEFDDKGQIWVVDQGPEWIEVFKPTGGSAIRRMEFDGSLVNRPCAIALDDSNGDIYLAQNGNPSIFRVTAASGYSPASAKGIGGFGPGSHKLAVNSSTNRLYEVRSTESGRIRAFNTVTGALVEEFGVGGGAYTGVAVDEATDTLYVSNNTTKRIQVFKPVVVPDATTGPQIGNSTVSGSVGLAGLIPPTGEVTECKFEYGAGASPPFSYPNSKACSPAVPYAVDQPSVTAELTTGITNETTYHYRLAAKNANGEGKGEDLLFTPHWVDFLKTEPATAIQRTEATLNGSFEGTGLETSYKFEYGPTAPAYGSETPLENKGVTAGPTPLSANVSGLTAGTTYNFRVYAEDSTGVSKAENLTFTTAAAVKDLETTAATDLEPTAATLNGSLDPDGIATEFSFEYGKTTAYGSSTPFEPVGTMVPGATPVSEGITGLEAGETYHFRVLAKNSFGTTVGEDRTFKAAQAPSLIGVSSENVAATSADLTAVINPNGFATDYFFEYGTTSNYGSKAPLEPGKLPAGEAPQSVSVPLSGLSEGVTYHFRLVAENQWGDTTSENQTFDFSPPTGCPNHNVRQQTSSAYLPDCRAYELVSPERQGGAFLFPFGPRSALASNPGRFAFAGVITQIPDTGEPMVGNFGGDLYVSSRTNSGWKTRYVGIPASHSLAQTGPPGDEGTIAFEAVPPPIEGAQSGLTDVPTDDGMNKFLVWDGAQTNRPFNAPAGSTEGSYAPFLYDNLGNFISRLPTNVEEIPGGTADITQGGFRGDSKPSADFSHYAFSSNDLAFAEGGLTTSPGSAYDNDLETGAVEIISKTPAGENIPGKAGDWIQIPAVSPEGSHILMATLGTAAPNPPPVLPSTYHLYMRVNNAISYDVSTSEVDGLNHEVSWVGATRDLSRVFFTSPEQLTADDTDTGVDLYMWVENGGSPDLVRLSHGTEGSVGNSDACGAVWISKCGIQVVPTKTEPRIDSPFARETGEIYFYSPEQLDGTKGIPSKRNLYVYRNGTARHVVTLEPEKGASRIQVTPDGDWMAFITASRVTAYDSESASEMYRYNAETDSIVCVSCPPNGAEALSQVEGSTNGLFMTDDGRVFFSTGDDLVPRDADGVRDVYEYVDGRAQLISSGRSDAKEVENQEQIGLVSVSADGVDAFFATVDTLVGQDENGPFLKFYDARTNGGFPFTKPPAPCVAADECHGKESATPAPLTIGSGAALGSRGNVQPKKAKRKRCGKRRRCRRKRSRGHTRARRHSSKGRRHG
jgi:hypothetical protein